MIYASSSHGDNGLVRGDGENHVLGLETEDAEETRVMAILVVIVWNSYC